MPISQPCRLGFFQMKNFSKTQGKGLVGHEQVGGSMDFLGLCSGYIVHRYIRRYVCMYEKNRGERERESVCLCVYM